MVCGAPDFAEAGWEPPNHLRIDANVDLENDLEFGVPYGSRTRVAAVKGRCPRPLDERDVIASGSRIIASS